LAGLASDLEIPTLVIDLHPYFGEVAPLCEWRPDGDLISLLEGELTSEQLAKHASTGRGFDVLAGPRHFESGENLAAESMEPLLKLAAHEYDLVLLDVPDSITEVVLSCLELADHVVLSLTADFEGVLAGRQVRQLLSRLEIPDDVLWVLLNRYRGSGGITPNQLRGMLAWPTAIIAEDSGQLLHMANDGRLWEVSKELADHPLVSACRFLLGRILGVQPAETAPPPEIYLEERALLSAASEASLQGLQAASKSRLSLFVPALFFLLALLGLLVLA
jgi:septum formation inhibitor-activating ATPase MinD